MILLLLRCEDVNCWDLPKRLRRLGTRFYFDDRDLNGFHNGTEFRIEGPRKKELQWPFKQVIKLAESLAAETSSDTLSRQEYVSKLKELVPSLKGLDKDVRAKLLKIFNVKRMKDLALLPLVRIDSQRWKMLYHPDGDPESQLEIALDILYGQTIAGFSWETHQVEIEVKEGTSDVLEQEVQFLKCSFSTLVPDVQSKPYPGFISLYGILQQGGLNKSLPKHPEALSWDA